MPVVLAPGTANSILAEMPLDPTEEHNFFSQVSQLVHTYAEIYHIGFFTLDTNEEWIVFRGGSTGGATDRFLQVGYKLNVSDPSTWTYHWPGRVIRNDRIVLVDIDKQKALIFLLSSEPHKKPDIELETECNLAWGCPLLPEARWELFLPLRSIKRTRGIIWVQTSDISGFDAEDIVYFQQLADQTAIRLWPSQ